MGREMSTKRVRAVWRSVVWQVLVCLLFSPLLCAEPVPDDVAHWRQDLHTPAVTDETPAAGKRVRIKLPANAARSLYHALYLPVDWKTGEKYPVIFEYPGNGPYRNARGDVNSGKLEDCDLGYGVSGGKGFIWVCLPFVNSQEGRHQLQWWGDADATADYCLAAADQVCRDWGGDRQRLVLAGFSRGAIACNYIGLRNERIAALWRCMIVHSHYDGVRRWPYDDSDEAAALIRLKRLRGRPQFVTHEGSIADTDAYLKRAGAFENITRAAVPFLNHTGAWMLREVPTRDAVRKWLTRALE